MTYAHGATQFFVAGYGDPAKRHDPVDRCTSGFSGPFSRDAAERYAVQIAEQWCYVEIVPADAQGKPGK